ncbi:juvenile hormone esterase-like [Onthophagus taurus]|uniref:juvenile hormone esterase-like n=1 Tax=Onthophagus taurus TaxID=166361 RepID=UPI0039BE811D
MNKILVSLQQGLIRGKLSRNYKNGTFYSFFGIPYAKPPLGKLRFKNPEPPERWIGTLNATTEKDGCISKNIFTRKLEGSEDCLHLNVYTPNLNNSQSSSLKPVIVFVHGHGLVAGNAKTELHGPDFFLTEDIVLVTVCYRYGAFGFSYLEDQSLGVNGNQGIKDVVMSLKWVQQNIRNFCGDPNNVTLFGASGGAGIAHHIMLSSLCNGMIHKLILHGGCSLSLWATSRKDSLTKLGEELKFVGENEKRLLEFLQTKSAISIYEGQKKVLANSIISPNVQKHFFPIIENQLNNSVLTEDPKLIISKGNYTKVPILMGHTSDEGFIFGKEAERRFKENSGVITNLDDLVPYNLKDSKGIIEKIKKFYFNGNYPKEKDLYKYLQVKSDIYCAHPLQTAIKAHLITQSLPIYFFKFAFHGKLNLYKKIQGVTKPVASHSDELCYLFRMFGNPEVEENSDEDLTIKRMVKLWTNFAKFGNPNGKNINDDLINVQWDPVELNKFNYLCIDKELTAGVNPDEDGVKFWEDFYKDNN